MWGTILGWAVLVALNPMLLGAILLVLSRPRPVQNLFVFWAGCVAVNVPAMLIPLAALHVVPSFASFAQGLTTPDPHSGIQPLGLGTGLLALCIAVGMAVRHRVRRREPVPAVVGGSVLVLDTDAEPEEVGTDSRRPGLLKRLMGRARDEWDSGALWVSLVLAIPYMLPPPLILLINTVIVGSGTAISTQIVAALVFVAVMLAVFEITLVGYTVAPARTQAILEPVHGWALAHRTQVLIVLFAIVGAWQVVTGLGLV